MPTASALYYPYTWPESGGTLRDLLLYFADIHVLGADSDPRNRDVQTCLDEGLVTVLQPLECLTPVQVQRVGRRAERMAAESGFFARFNGLYQDVDRYPLAEELAGPSLEEVRAAWNSDPDLMALRAEVGLENDDPDFVVIQRGKFGYSRPAMTLLIEGAMSSRQKGGSTELSDAARRAEAWLEGSGGFYVNRETAASLMTSLAMEISQTYGYVPTTDTDSAGRLMDSTMAGNVVERYNRSPGELAADDSGPSAKFDRVMAEYRNEKFQTVDLTEANAYLVRMVMSAVTLDDNTSIEDVLRFRHKYRADLVSLHQLIEDMAEGLRGTERVTDQIDAVAGKIWDREVEKRLSDLEGARKREGLRAGLDLMKAAFYSSPPSVASVASHAPSGVTIGATIAGGLASILVTGKKLEADRDALISRSPVGYIFRAGKAL
jgi:Family of unknown function (DUF6236)